VLSRSERRRSFLYERWSRRPIAKVHARPDRGLLLLPSEQPEDAILESFTCREDVTDALQLLRHHPVTSPVSRIQVLSLAADDLRPAEVLAQNVQGV
jgi:hypothetical protein